MKIIDQLEWRYATKAFDPEKLLPKEKVATVLQAFNLTATSYGLQPIKLVVVSDKALQATLVDYSMNQKQIAQASHVLVFCIETNVDKAFVAEYFERVHKIRHTDKQILKPFKDFLVDDFENKTQQAIEAWATNQAYLALGNIMTVCALEAIDACPMEGFEPEQYDQLLNLKEKGLKSVLLLPIGYRAANDMFSNFKKVRRPLTDSVIIY
ncbi:nitroreductase [Mangrovimonas yunxiaonensis]|uniref:Nitroreductase n=1 Tax=Mangrovimonas yunxiaonensis TaxID=1197477 RepID=A0A084TJT2_9FLAO|nr:NAD(P)H-dependent oxidoreductase [Mangrovimonas yunxiaonensis]KFB00968.1 nitroreductase [Mangrovimonas yunxiaonensis]GGH43308.1 NAD(P)H-dependent oxidoreductase [Mangrovimonas yunxiaonensis]